MDQPVRPGRTTILPAIFLLIVGLSAPPVVDRAAADAIQLVGQGLPGETSAWGRFGFGLVYDGGSAYLFGGYAAPEGRLGDVVKYNPTTNSFTQLGGHMWEYPGFVGAAKLGGSMYVFGIQDDDVYQTPNRIQRYDPTADSFSNVTAKLPVPCSPSATSTGSKIYIVGCVDTTASLRYKIYSFDGGTVSEIASRASPYGDHTIYAKGNVYIFGGQQGRIHRLDPSTNSVTEMNGRTDGVSFQRSCWDGHNIYVFGGTAGGTKTDTILKYNVTNDLVTFMSAKLPTGRSSGGAFFHNSACYYVGGSGALGTTPQKEVLRYVSTPAAPALRDVYLGPGPGKVTLEWNAIAPNTYGVLEEQRIYTASSAGGPFSHLSTVQPATLSHEDTSWAVGSIAYYHISGVDELYGEGPDSNTLATMFRVTADQAPANEVDLAMRPGAPSTVVAVAKDYSLNGALGPGPCGGPAPPGVPTRVWAGIYRSTDGGRTWSSSYFPGAPTGPADTEGYQCMSDPIAAFAPGGTLYTVGLAYGKPIRDVAGHVVKRQAALLFASSTNAGFSWSTPSVIVEGFEEADPPVPPLDMIDHFPDKEMIAVSPTDGSIYVSYNFVDQVKNPLTGEITYSTHPFIARSTDGGTRWISTAVGADEGHWTHPVVNKQGDLFVTMNAPDPASPTGTAVVSFKSTDQGRTFTRATIGPAIDRAPPDGTSHGYRVAPISTIAVDTSTAATAGNLYVAWSNWEATTSRWHLQVARSADDGDTWLLSQPGYAANTHQVLPRVSVSPSGTVGVLYYEDTGTSAAPGDVRAKFVASTDGGATWATPIQISKDFSPTPMKHQDGSVFIGDYVGLQWGTDGLARAAWADGRSGVLSDIYFAKVKP